MNYLALVALKHYAAQEGPYQVQAADAYTQLRGNVLTVR